MVEPPGGTSVVCTSVRGGGQRGLVVDPVEDLADHMERRGEVGAADAEEDAHGLANIGLQRASAVSAPSAPLKTKYSGCFIEHFLTLKACTRVPIFFRV
jgi:hypothetical protein